MQLSQGCCIQTAFASQRSTLETGQNSLIRVPLQWVEEGKNEQDNKLALTFLKQWRILSKGKILTKTILCTYWLSGRAGRENIWPEVMAYGPSILLFEHCAFPFFFLFSGNQIRKVHLRRYLDRKVGIYKATKLFQFASRARFHRKTIGKIPVWWRPCASLAGPDGFFRPCSRHRVRPSYGDFLNRCAVKARAGPYVSYDKKFSALLMFSF